MADQIRQRAGGAVGTARERVEGAVADVRERALRDRARHVSAAEVAPHTQRSSRGLMWLLAAIALIGVLALLVARARRNDAAAPLPEGKVEGLEAPRTPPVIPEPPKVVSPGVAPEAKQSAPARPEPQTAPPEGVLGEEQDQPSTPPPEADEIDVLTVSSGAGPLMIFLKSNEPPPRHFDLQLVEFESGSSDVDGNEGLDTIADVLREHSGAKIRLVGYADPVGSTESNLKLSRERARQVKKYLVDRGVASERVETDGLGESRPKPDPEARAENRRVELIVTSR